MHGSRWARITLLLAAMMAAQTPLLRGQAVPAAWEHTATAVPKTTDVAVIGQVVRPGLYRVPASSPTLLDVIRAAGGLTERASGNLRVIRGGQVLQHVFVSPARQRGVFGGDLSAASGDLIVVDEVQPKQTSLRPVGHVPDRPISVQLAFVNLAPLPAVVRVSGEHATVPGVLRLLNQPVDAAPTIQVLRGDGGDADTAQTSLPSGSVLIFDPSVIEIEKMPPLPPPILADVPRPIPDERLVGEEYIAEDEVELAPEFPTPVDVRRDTTTPSHGAAVEMLAAPPDEADQPLRIAERPEVPEPIDLPWQSDINSGPWGTEEAPRSARPGFGSDERIAAAGSEFHGLGSSAAAEFDADAAESPVENAGFDGRALIAVLVVTGLSIYGLLRIRRGVKQTRAAAVANAETSKPTAQSVLAALIYDELPIVEDSMEIPAGLQLSGRIGSGRRLRAEPAQSLAPPHYPAVTPAPQEKPAIVSSVPSASRVGSAHRIDTAGAVAGPIRERAKTRSSGGLLDRVLSAVNQERRS